MPWQGSKNEKTGSDVLTGLPISTMEESDAVGDDWFDDACLIGHSQIIGMQKYSGITGADYYAVIGHTARAVVDYELRDSIHIQADRYPEIVEYLKKHT